jgi:two-component system, NtrC family, sensor kinase
VASPWRIRHKLMLGLGLVVGIMALLLGGTLRGLWSYYLTLNSIRSLLTELKAAQEFKESVADVISRAEDPNDLLKKAREGRNHKREAPAPPARADLLPELAGEPAPHKGKPATLRDAIANARLKLEEYERQLLEALNHGRDAINGEHALGTIAHLRNDFKELENAMAKAGEPRMGMVKPNVAMRDEDWEALQDQVDAIERGTDDLCSHIYDELHQRINESRSHYQGALWVLIPTSIVGLVLVFGLLWSFYAWVFYPIRDLALGVNVVARGDFDHRIELHSGDEMADLGAAFNDMMERLQELYRDLARQVNERSRQLVRSERLASVGFLAAGVAHEINNPLASIAFCSEALEARLAGLLRQARDAGRGGDDQEVFARYLKMIQEEAFRCKNITERLLAFSRSSERRREEVDLRELVQSVLDVTQHLQNHRGKHIDFEVFAERVPGGRITAWVNGEEIKSVVLNLVVNALDSMDEGGRLTIRLAQKAGMAELQFADTGCGMTQEVLENIFEPFFTRSRTGKGTGLGLTISHRIISQHGGEIEASSAGPNKGSTFTVRLPVQPAEPPALPGAEDAPAPRRPGLAA